MKAYAKLLVLLTLVIAGALVVRFTDLGDLFTIAAMMDFVERLRESPFAPVLFVLVYVAATALALPGSAITLVGGAVFGFWYGSLLNAIGANIGANLAFLISRTLGREGVQKIAGKRLDGLNRATEAHGFFGMLMLRLVPLVPFNLLNFGSGLSGLRWRDYMLATLIGMLPGTLVYTFFADALIQGSTQAKLLATAMLLGLSLIPVVARMAGWKMETVAPSEKTT